MNRFYSPYDIGRILGVSPRTVRNWVKEGSLQGFPLRHTKRGAHVRVWEKELILFMRRQGMPLELLAKEKESVK